MKQLINPYPKYSDEWELFEEMLSEQKTIWEKSKPYTSYIGDLEIFNVDLLSLNKTLEDRTSTLKELETEFAHLTKTRTDRFKKNFVLYMEILGIPKNEYSGHWDRAWRNYFFPDKRQAIINTKADIKTIRQGIRHLQAKEKGQETLDVETARKYPIEKLFNGKLRITGANAIGLCPFHKEKTPSFIISRSKNKYQCYGCGEHGDAIDFYQKVYNVEFKTAVKALS